VFGGSRVVAKKVKGEDVGPAAGTPTAQKGQQAGGDGGILFCT